jgi:uncharacterized RDD family membrane protein YckC
MHVEESARIVIDEADLWRPIEDRSFALETENRRKLDSRRAIAYLIDRLVLLVPSAFAVGVFGDDRGILVATALTLVYFFVWESLSGQTFGKRVLGLRVVRRDGAPLNLAAVAARNVLLLVDQFVGIFFIVATRRRQRLGDLVAGTVVTAAADHVHVASNERFRGAILAGYPVAWLGAAVAVAIFTSTPANTREYLRVANLTCTQASTALNAGPNVGVAEAHGILAGIERSLRALDVPASKRAAHDRLVAGMHRQRALLGAAEQAQGVQRVAVLRQYQGEVAEDAPQFRADGYPGCA